MFLAFLGCDGAGKSTVIAGATERLRVDGVAITQGHWRPVAPQMESGGQAAKTADNPHGQMPRGMVSSLLKLCWLAMNWWIGWWRFLRNSSRNGVVVFDRYHADLLVDPRRYRYGGPMWLARFASHLMPQPDVVVFLDAPPEVLLARKKEVSEESLIRSRAAYLILARSHPRFRVIDASRPLDQVVSEVLDLVTEAHGRH